MAIIRRMVRSNAMCRAFAAAYAVNGPQGRRMKSGRQISPLTQTRRGRKMNELRAIDGDLLV